MSKTFFCLAFSLLIASVVNPLWASAERPMTLEVRAAAFAHYSDRFRSIYGRVGPSFQIEASGQACGCMHAWINSGWSYQTGKSVGFHDRTKTEIADLSMGVKFAHYFRERCMSYVGIGPSFARIWLKNKSRKDIPQVAKNSVGGTLKIGLNYLICHNLFIDLFVDYVYQPVHFRKQVDIGGLKGGLGLGINF